MIYNFIKNLIILIKKYHKNYMIILGIYILKIKKIDKNFMDYKIKKKYYLII